MANFLKTTARAVVKLDPSLAPKDIAALADAGLTAYHAVKKAVAILQPGTKAVVIGAGGLGHIGYGGKLNVPTIDIISTEINFIGNLVGTYNDLAELMTLTAQGKVELHTAMYPLDAANDAIHDLDSGKLRGRGILIP